MSRDPSLHITKSKLRRFIIEWQQVNLEMFEDFPIDDLANHIMKRGVNQSLLNRGILDPKNDTQIKSLNRLSSAKMDDATLFNTLLSDVRVQMKHRGFVRVNKFDSDWPFIVEMSKLALEFSKAFNMERRTGFIEYIKNYFSVRPGQFRLRQMKSFHESIIARQNVIEEIEHDNNPNDTELGYRLYQHMVFDKTGINPKYDKKDNPEKYIFFVKVSKVAAELGLDTQDYILGQFESLDWTGGFPSPEQLVTLNAKDRVLKWMSENNVVKEKKKDTSALDEWNRLKNKKNGHNNWKQQMSTKG